MPEEIPHKFFNLKELSRYLADKNNSRFNIENRELEIIFRIGKAEFEIEADMMPDVREFRESMLKHKTKVLRL